MSVLSSRIMKGSTSRLALLALAGSYAPAAAFGGTPAPHPYKDFWCVSGLNKRPPNQTVSGTSSALACLEECKAAYPGVAKYGELDKGECWCQASTRRPAAAAPARLEARRALKVCCRPGAGLVRVHRRKRRGAGRWPRG